MPIFAAAGFEPLVLQWHEFAPAAHEKGQGALGPAARLEAIADRIQGRLADLGGRPVVVGHSTGGLLAQILAGRGSASATVAISPAPFRGVVPLPHTRMRRTPPGPGRDDGSAVPLTFEQFRSAFANALGNAEARELHARYAVAPSARGGAPMGIAIDPWVEIKVDTVSPQRGPLLILAGSEDRVVPSAIARASYHVQRRNGAVTEFSELAGRGHSLTIDRGWHDVASASLGFLTRQLAAAHRDAEVHEAERESFPASDPAAY